MPLPLLDDVLLSERKAAVAPIVQKARGIVALGVEQRRLRDAKQDASAVTGQINARFDDLLGDLMADFPSNGADRARVQDIFARGKTIDLLDASVVAGLEPELVPVAVVREICHRYRVRFSPEQMPNWPSFLTRYQSVIVG